jgi:uncharacterized protein (DUF433 family)
MTLQELENQLLNLSDGERIRMIRLLSQDRNKGIEKTQNVCGGSACIVGTRLTVWGLVEARQLGYSEADLLISYPTLSATGIANAWAYANAFPLEIEAEIKANQAVMEEEL